MYKIEKNIPLPSRRKAGKSAERLAIEALEVSDSVEVAGSSISVLAWRVGQALDRRFSVRVQSRGWSRELTKYRVWRIE